MRAVLSEEVPGALALEGRGESIPLEEGSVEAVLASTSWHWMDLLPTLSEVHRVLVHKGVLGALWTGPDPQGPFIARARQVLAGRSNTGESPGEGESGLSAMMLDAAGRPASTLEIPEGTGFTQPEHETFEWDIALTADELIGLLHTFSWVITMPEETRNRVLSEARRMLRDLLGVEGEVTVDVAFRCEAYRAYRIA
jgi:SAM-dependent methyltransferase